MSGGAKQKFPILLGIATKRAGIAANRWDYPASGMFNLGGVVVRMRALSDQSLVFAACVGSRS